MSFNRARWAALGAAVAVTIGGGGLGIANAVSSGERAIYVAITPCRLMDTRPPPDNVGTRSTPIAQAETSTVQAHGSNGDCSNIPTDATAIALNVTAVDATTLTFLTLWPSDEPFPNTSSLNPAFGQPPTPNAVTSLLSPSGSFKLYNHQGTVDVIADVVGYFVDHNHDDRYYTEDEVDALNPALTPVTKYLSIPPAAFAPRYSATTEYQTTANGNLFVTSGTTDAFSAPVHLPDGAKLTAMHAWVADGDIFNANLLVQLSGIRYNSGFIPYFSVTSGFHPDPTKLTDTTLQFPQGSTVDNEDYMYAVSINVPGSNWASYGSTIRLAGVTIEYTVLE